MATETNLNLKKVRLSFNDLWEAKSVKGGAPSYGATVLIPEGSDHDKLIRKVLKQIADEKFGKTADAKLKKYEGNNMKICYTSGEDSEYDGYEGMMVLRAKRSEKQGKPGVFDSIADPATGKPRRIMTADGRIYSGCFVNLKANIYAQDGEFEGFRCSLVGVQFAGDGDSFAGSRAASDDDFEAAEEGADADELE